MALWALRCQSYFKKILNIITFHHFRFSKNELGIVSCQEFLSSPEQAFFFLLRNGIAIPPVSVLPQKINPEGLSEECWNYLYHEIGHFCKLETKDFVAPVPWSVNFSSCMMFVDAIFHNSVPCCKRIRIIVAVIVYTPVALAYVIKQWSSTE